MSEAMHRCDGCETLFSEDQLVTIDGKRLCAQCKMGFVADVRSGLSGSGVELAGLGARLGAVIIDTLIFIIPVVLIFLGGRYLVLGQFDFAGKESHTFLDFGLQCIAACIFCVYEGLMIAKSGQTIGKKVMKVKVVMLDGSAVLPKASWKRTIFREALGLIPSGMVAVLDALFIFGKARRTLHDRFGGTIVIKAG